MKKTIITIALAGLGFGVGYATSRADWKEIEEAGLGFVISFVVSMFIALAYNRKYTLGEDIAGPDVLRGFEYWGAVLLSGVCACILPYILK